MELVNVADIIEGVNPTGTFGGVSRKTPNTQKGKTTKILKWERKTLSGGWKRLARSALVQQILLFTISGIFINFNIRFRKVIPLKE